MLSLFGIGKKKISEEKVANIMVNILMQYCEDGFPRVAEMINASPEFNSSPNIDSEDFESFLMILIVANIFYLHIKLDSDLAFKVQENVIKKFAAAYEITEHEFEERIKEYRTMLTTVNYPSKNMLYAMSKGMFSKYNLCNFQEEEYFRTRNAANPIFLKRLDEIMTQFIFDWDDFINKYKVSL